MVGKRTPTIFIYDLAQNTIQRVFGIAADLLPTYPIFDEQSNGIIFSAVTLQTKKLGMRYCLNRPTGLYYIKAPIFDKDLAAGNEYITKLTSDLYLAMLPQFSPDFSSLIYFGSEANFNSHIGNY